MKLVLLLLLCCNSSFVQAQLPTKIIDSYGVKFIVAEKVPEELKFLMGSYRDVNSDKTIKLNSDGTINLEGKNFKYWFECTNDNLVAKMPNLEGYYPKDIPAAKRFNYSMLSLIVASPYTLQSTMTFKGKTYASPDSIIVNFRVVHMMVNIEDRKAFINESYKQDISGNLLRFEAVTKVGFIAPIYGDTKGMCDVISIQMKPSEDYKEYFDYDYERMLMNFAGADIKKESRESATAKIIEWWNKYKTMFYCQSSSFNLDYGNILKFAVSKGFAPFLETIVGTYQMDINFIDPADNRNVLDYVNDELKKTISLQGPNHQQVKILKEYKELLEDLGGKPSRPVKD